MWWTLRPLAKRPKHPLGSKNSQKMYSTPTLWWYPQFSNPFIIINTDFKSIGHGITEEENIWTPLCPPSSDMQMLYHAGSIPIFHPSALLNESSWATSPANSLPTFISSTDLETYRPADSEAGSQGYPLEACHTRTKQVNPSPLNIYYNWNIQGPSHPDG